jgi:exonuclease III
MRADTGDRTWTAVVWNLNEGRHPNPAAWKKLEKYDADVAVLCEARFTPGPDRVGHGKTIGRDCRHETEDECDSRPFSTAIVSRHRPTEIRDATATRRGKPLDIPFRPSRPGTWVAATVFIEDVGDISVVSLYGLTDEKTDASVHRSLSDLEPIFEDSRYNRMLLVAGDLNTFANPSPSDPARERHHLVLKRIEAYGLKNLFEQKPVPRRDQSDAGGKCPCGEDDCTHAWTFRSRDPRYTHIRYQDDHVFASRPLARKLRSCKSAGFNEASDHAPILVTFGA